MRKYLWAIALCAAAGIAVPSWAQERSKSLFGLGRSSKTEANESEKLEKPKKTEKSSKLKNYSELFGKNSQKKGTADAPSPDDVQKMTSDTDEGRVTTRKADPLASDASPTGKASTAGKSSPGGKSALVAQSKSRAPAKASLLDEESLDDIDALEEQEEREEMAEEEARAVVKKTVPRKPSPPVKPAPPKDYQASTRPQPPAKPAVKTAAVEKPAPPKPKSTAEDLPDWASSDLDVESFEADLDLPGESSESPSIKQVEADDSVPPRKAPASLSEKSEENPFAKDALSAEDEPAEPETSEPASRVNVVNTRKGKLYAPISVDASSDKTAEDEIAAADAPQKAKEEHASAAETESSALEPASKPSSRLTITRGNSQSSVATKVSHEENAAPADAEIVSHVVPAVASTPKSASSVTQTPTVTVEFRSTGAVTVGQESACELIVKNSGSVTAQQVEVEAQLPGNIRLISTEPSAASETKLVWEFAEIEAGAEKVIHVKFIPVERGEVAASASVRFTGAATTSFAVTEPMLALSLQGATEVMVGESASQTLIISNPGTGTAANVKVEAILPPGLEHAKGDRLLMDLGNLAPGENRPVRLALTAIAGGRQVIEVHSTADNGLVKSAAAEVSVIAPSLHTSIEGPGLRYLGRHATYTLHVDNDGAVATDNVRVMHKIPEGFEFISAEKGAQYDAHTQMLTWFVGRMEKGASAQISVVLNAKTAGEYTHFIRATSENGVTSDADVSTRVEGAASLVVDVADLDDPVEVGVETAYEIRVKNEGTAPATNVALTCELPSGVEFQTATAETKFAHQNDQIVFDPVTEIAPGKTLTYRVKFKGTLSGNMRFRTRVSSDSLNEPLTSEEMTKVYSE